jgi:hypothetical protein
MLSLPSGDGSRKGFPFPWACEGLDALNTPARSTRAAVALFTPLPAANQITLQSDKILYAPKALIISEAVDEVL